MRKQKAKKEQVVTPARVVGHYYGLANSTYYPSAKVLLFLIYANILGEKMLKFAKLSYSRKKTIKDTTKEALTGM